MQEAAEALFECVKFEWMHAVQLNRRRVMSCLSDTPGLHFSACWGAPCHCRQDAQGGRGDEEREDKERGKEEKCC